jgi:hypothetical protein
VGKTMSPIDQTDFQSRVEHKLGEIEAKLDIVLPSLMSHIKEDKHIFYGHDGQEGLVQRVDRLTVEAKQREGHIKLLGVAIVGIATEIVVRLVRTFHGF